MKIAILTLPLHTNYGGILQCYALSTVLKQMGHDVEVISSISLVEFRDVLFGFKKRFVNKLRGKFENIPDLTNFLMQRKIRHFINTQIQFGTNNSAGNVFDHSSKQNYDVYIVGSDQVWRPLYARNIDKYFFSFLEDKQCKKIAYSASFGVDYEEYSSEQIEECGKLFSLFKAISVREKSALRLIETYNWQYKGFCVQTLDPTMLLTKNDYVNAFHLKMDPRPHSLFTYVLDESILANELLGQIKLEKDWEICQTTSTDFSLIGRAIPSPIKWMEYIGTSELVVTDSFHGCVFSILFNKPFVVVGNKERGMARITSLLEMFELTERLVYSISDFNERRQALLSPVCYIKVNKILELERIESFTFLNGSLR